ncbi:hypothetical protein Bca101_044002 [Brassica carinata]
MSSSSAVVLHSAFDALRLRRQFIVAHSWESLYSSFMRRADVLNVQSLIAKFGDTWIHPCWSRPLLQSNFASRFSREVNWRKEGAVVPVKNPGHICERTAMVDVMEGRGLDVNVANNAGYGASFNSIGGSGWTDGSDGNAQRHNSVPCRKKRAWKITDGQLNHTSDKPSKLTPDNWSN